MKNRRMLRNIWAATIVMASLTLAQIEEGGEYIHYRLGMKYKAEKQYDDAVEEFRKVLAEYPDNYNAYMNVAEIRIEQGHTRFAIYNLKQALAYNPGWGKAFKLLAVQYENDGQVQMAIGEYQNYLNSCDPAERDSIQGVIDRLVSTLGAGARLADAGPSDVELPEPLVKPSASALDTLPKPPKDSAAAREFWRALSHYRQGQDDSALVGFRKVLALSPGFKGAYAYAGVIRHRRNETGAARINLRKGSGYKDLPDYTSLLCFGKIRGGDKQYGEAVRHLSRYCALSDSEEGKREARALLARYRPFVKRFSDSVAKADSLAADSASRAVSGERLTLEVRIDSLLSMVTVDTLIESGRAMLGGIREFQSGNFDRAIREFRKSQAAHPTGPVSLHSIYNSGICYLKLRLFKEAEHQFSQVIERYPEDPLAEKSRFLMALSNGERNELSRAEELYRAFLQSNRGHPWEGKGWEKLGDIYRELEQPRKAVDAFSQAIQRAASANDLVSAYFKSGCAHVAIGSTKRAFAAFDSAIAKGESGGVYVRVPDSYYRCADEKYKNRDFRGALSYYARAVKKYPAFQETPWGLFQTGNIQKRLSRYKDAVATYKDLMARFPDDYWARQARWKLDDAVWENDYKATLR